ncbi:bifunctional oligoribonuclease/PAP phosphatase NrnA [Gordonia sp. X0973]|uniref:DHH family phosphoesterase n=1 Tax=Gordonia sp. X0973 TaxID=2742602 RepID=UPI000F5297D8|nr:bifunctional oligoribonuclease/PAP phosphatase NrnA [Gordonia sp. X0973]QKT07092.1 bifunctional oligoribonuclease/PAP phosphatase NrnA [Gordonia sp. X0973]
MTAASAADVASALRGADAVTILCHVRPDPDTLGSGLALGQALVGLGMAVEVAYPGDLPLPSAMKALPGSELLVRPDAVVGHPVAVSVDAATLGRLEDLGEVFGAARERIVVDHHVSNTGFGTLDFIDPSSDCTASLVLEIIDELGVTLTEPIATCVYAGLITDTGSFKWARPSSFGIAARLIEAGVDGAKWSRTLLDSHPFTWFGVASAVLGDAKLESAACGGAGLVYATVPHELLSSMAWDESESLIDLVRTAQDAEVAAVFKESEPGRWNVSLRSKDKVDVTTIARAFGGGGHIRAAGYSIDGTSDEVAAALLAQV